MFTIPFFRKISSWNLIPPPHQTVDVHPLDAMKVRGWLINNLPPVLKTAIDDPRSDFPHCSPAEQIAKADAIYQVLVTGGQAHIDEVHQKLKSMFYGASTVHLVAGLLFLYVSRAVYSRRHVAVINVSYVALLGSRNFTTQLWKFLQSEIASYKTTLATPLPPAYDQTAQIPHNSTVMWHQNQLHVSHCTP
jgi:hypothetical protein